MIDMDQNKSLKAELDELLSEDVASVIERERTAFDRLIEPFGKSLVLFGAGNFGRQVLACLRRDGNEPLAFVDNNSSLWGKTVDGIPVFSPYEAARRFGQRAAFLITIRSPESQHRFVETKQRLHTLSCRRVVSFMPFLWKYAETFLPYFYIDLPHKIYDNAEALKDTFNLWADAESRRAFFTQLEWRVLPDFDSLPGRTIYKPYFPKDIFSLRADETFVDCGAYDGDTIREFLDHSGGSFNRIVAFEPDPRNFQNLATYVGNLPKGIGEKIILLNKAVGAKHGRLRFDGAGSASSHESPDGSIEVESVALDGILKDYSPSYIKLDVEGDESEALIGAQRIIGKKSPILAVCIYHRLDDLWRIPLLIQSFFTGYRYFLRAHNEEGWELVCYAVPNSRVLS